MIELPRTSWWTEKMYLKYSVHSFAVGAGESQLNEDAGASLETNHVISKIAARFVDVMDMQMITSMRIIPSVWQSEAVKEMRKERFNLSERELLKWAVDVTAKIL